jgi:NADH dehydrogenase [ubiquinone] 1 alpha subcomplex assembly factor 1
MFSHGIHAQQKHMINDNSLNNSVYKKQSSKLIMIDFTKQQAKNNWRVSNDNVMGGLSQGYIEFVSEKVIFRGNISLENNGGFSSVFHDVKALGEGLHKVNLNMQGDGQRYQIRLIANNNGKRVYYYHEFNTLQNKRQNLSFMLSDFQATFRGKKITDAPVLKSQLIEEVGFLLTKKQAGEFLISLFSISFE